MRKLFQIALQGVCLSILGVLIPYLGLASQDISGAIAGQYGLANQDTNSLNQGTVGPFGGLNTYDTPSVIGSNQAQDMLNVDIAPGGKSAKKRPGYSLDTTFTYSTSPVHGTYKFFNSSGNEVRLAGQDHGLYASVSGSAWVIVATGTYYTTWQCTDYLGFAYCVTAARDSPVKTDGTLANSSYLTLNSFPAGSLISSTADRLLVANTAANPSNIYYSVSTVFTDFTLGVQAASASFEPITAPGANITHIAYHYGRWLWWKNQSFGYIIGTDQTNLQIVVVSDVIGTNDNTDIYWEGLDYFRGQDGTIYVYDGSFLTPLSRDITPTVNSANTRKANTWNQTSQSDFNAGAIRPSNQLSTTVSVGDVTNSSFSVTENSSTQWNLGTNSNMSLGTSSMSLKVVDGNIPNNGFETGSIDNWTGTGTQDSSAAGVFCTLNPRTGSKMLGTTTSACTPASYNIYVSLWDCNTNVGYSTTTIAQANNSCTYTARTLSSSGLTGKSVKVKVSYGGGSGNCAGTNYVETSDCFVNSGTDMTFYTASDETRSSVPVLNTLEIDDVTSGSDTIRAGYYTSKVYDSGMTSATWQLQGTWTANTTTPTFSVLTATANPASSWTSILTTTGTNALSNRYALYATSISYVQGQNALTNITNWTLLSKSSGTYFSAVNNAPSITSWATLNETDSTLGVSSITYYYRASNTSFNSTDVSTPVWVVTSKNSTPASITAPYFQLRADFYITAATETTTLSDFTFNWFEGSASDKMYGTYWDYAIWFSVSLGTAATTNNRILRYDLLNQAWTYYDITSNGFLIYNNALYFGSPSAGKLYKFGSVTSDENSAINSYWKSKDFFGATPFQDEDYKTNSWFIKSSSGTTLNITYQVNESTQSTYTINLYDSKANIIRKNYNFPIGTVGNVINFKFGDNSTNTAWEVFAGQYQYTVKPWNVYP